MTDRETTGTLREDIRSNCKGLQLYGKKGERVKIICFRGDVAIVEGKERFPVHKSKLSYG